MVEIEKQGEVQGKKSEEEETSEKLWRARFSGAEMDSCGIKGRKLVVVESRDNL